MSQVKSRNTEDPVTRSSRPEEFLKKAFPKICSKFTGEHPGRSAISIKLHKNTFGWLLVSYKLHELYVEQNILKPLLHLMNLIVDIFCHCYLKLKDFSYYLNISCTG